MDGVADTPEKMDKYIRTIYNKANEMDALINELTFYCKIDTNRIPYTFNKINVHDYFEDCVEELSLDLESKNIDVTYNNSVDPDVLVIADSEQLSRVIHNIVNNSVKYIDKDEGHIKIRIKDVGDFIQVFELLHYEFSDELAVAFLLHGVVETAFDVVDDLLHVSVGDRALLACADDSVQELVPVESLAAAVLLDNHEDHFFDLLIGCEPSAAFLAFTSSSDSTAILGVTGIYDLAVFVFTIRALHCSSSPMYKHYFF